MKKLLIASLATLTLSTYADDNKFPAPVCNHGRICVNRVGTCRDTALDNEFHPTASGVVGLSTEIVCMAYNGQVTTINQSSMERISGYTSYGRFEQQHATADCQRKIDELIEGYGKCGTN